MYKNAFARLQSVYNLLESDPVYSELRQQFDAQEAQFHEVMEQLSQQQRDICTVHIGLLSEIYQRMMEIACFVE